MVAILSRPQCVDKMRLRQNGPHVAYEIFKCVFLNRNVWILIKKISIKFVFGDHFDDYTALDQVKAWGQTANKPLLSGRMLTKFIDAWPGFNELIWFIESVEIYYIFFWKI